MVAALPEPLTGIAGCQTASNCLPFCLENGRCRREADIADREGEPRGC